MDNSPTRRCTVLRRWPTASSLVYQIHPAAKDSARYLLLGSKVSSIASSQNRNGATSTIITARNCRSFSAQLINLRWFIVSQLEAVARFMRVLCKFQHYLYDLGKTVDHKK